MPRISQFAKVILAAAGAAALVACDDSRLADKRVQATLNEARLARLEGPEGLEKAQDLLNKAAQEAEASSGAKAQAKASLAKAQLDLANQQISNPENGVGYGNREIARIMWEIGQLSHQLQASNTLAEAYGKLEPKDATAAAAAQAAAVTGGPDKAVWIGENANAVPTIVAAQQKLATLQGEIKQQEQAIATLQTDRTAAVQQADQLQKQSDAQPGRAGFENFKAASQARKNATDTQTKIDVETVKLQRLQQDAALVQAQMDAVTKAKQQFESMSASLEKQWSGTPGVAEQVQAQKALAAEILAGKGEASIASKAAKLAKQTAETQAQYEKAETNLSEAIKNFQAASTEASKLSGDMRTASSNTQSDQLKKAMDQLVAIYNPNVFKLGEANATLALAQLQARKAQLLAQRAALVAALQPVAQQAGLSLPPDLNDAKLADELKTASEAAEAQFTNAQQLYEGAQTGVIESDRNAARAGSIYARYGRALLGRAIGNKQMAEESLGLAKQERDAVLQEGKNALAALPAELVVIGPIAPATAPTTDGAATVPATTEGAPATEGATTTPAAEGATTTPAAEGAAPAATEGAAPAATEGAATPAAPAEPAQPAQPQ